MSDLPPEIPVFTLDLMQEARWHDDPLPAQPPPVHHALHDARHDLLIATAIGLTAQETNRGQACIGLIVDCCELSLDASRRIADLVGTPSRALWGPLCDALGVV